MQESGLIAVTVVIMVAFCVVKSCVADGTKRRAAEVGQWWQYRGDRRLSGRSVIKGDIVTPALRWSHSVAGRETILSAAFGEGSESVPLPTADLATSPTGVDYYQLQQDWRLPGPYGASWLDLDGNGVLTACSRSYNQKIGKVLPEQAGLQMIETEPKGYPKVPGVYKGTVRLKVRENGQWVTRWETETDMLIWQAEPIFGDFDADGKNEIALLPWFRLTLLDAGTGKLKEQCNFLKEDESEIPGHGGRAYGWFGAVDVDGDGQVEFVIIEDFIRYATVIGRRNGRLQRLWLEVWEPRAKEGGFPSPDQTVVVRINPKPVQDIDGDGHKEILASVFNLSGDNRWHILALDSLTGDTKVDLPGQFLSGLHDADGDGVPELFCTATGDGPRIPEPTEVSLQTFKEGKLRRVWDFPRAFYVTYGTGDFPPNVNTGAALGNETVLCGPIAPGQPNVFFTRRVMDPVRGQVELTCWQAASSGKYQAVARWIGPRVEALMTANATDKRPSFLLRTTTFEGESAKLRGTGQRTITKVLVSRRVPAPLSPVVVGRPEPNAPPVVVVQGANETVEAFRPGRDGKTVRLWRVPGRGMTCNNYFEGALLADLSGEGRLSVVVGNRGKGDCARLSVLSAGEGRALWSRDFEDFPGTPPPWNVPGLMYWQGGYFRDKGRMDLLVQMRRVGGESYLLDGRTGEVLWQQTRGRTGRDFGRWWMAMYDFDGDGLEDILNTYPDMFCVARGIDGKLLVAEESVKYVDLYAYYNDTLVADFLGSGQPQVLYLHEFVTALFKGNGERVWKVDHPHPGGWYNPAGFGDVDGDGHKDLFFPGAMGKEGREFQCREAATGALKWRLPMPDERSTFPAVADLNGDGSDECVFTIGKTVYAVGSPKDPSSRAGAVLWKLALPDRAGPVAIADVEGNGVAQIVVGCADGHVYGIGQTTTTSQTALH